MAITEYGTIGIRPMGTYDPDTKYGLLNLVEFDGSSYVAHTDPPLGSLPTNTAYWQVSAQGTGKATASSVGTVKPDGATTEVNSDGSMSVKTALQDALGLVKGSNGIKVGADGSIDVNTLFTQATEMANIIAGEAIATALGKISKSIAVTIGLDQNALLKNMLTNIDANDSTKINTAAYVHKLTERIGMGDELTIGANLTAGLNALNSNLVMKANASDLNAKSIGNAIANTGWEITASNLTINNTIGLLYGKIKYTGTNTPAWGNVVGNFPNYHSGYNLPLLLYRTSGDLCLTASVNTGGTIFVYNPDISKIVTGAEFHFQATYVVG